MQRILTIFKRLAGHGLQSLNDRFVAWTKPDITSLLLATLTDQARSKSELVAENARLASTSVLFSVIETLELHPHRVGTGVGKIWTSSSGLQEANMVW